MQIITQSLKKGSISILACLCLLSGALQGFIAFACHDGHLHFSNKQQHQDIKPNSLSSCDHNHANSHGHSHAQHNAIPAHDHNNDITLGDDLEFLSQTQSPVYTTCATITSIDWLSTFHCVRSLTTADYAARAPPAQLHVLAYIKQTRLLI